MANGQKILVALSGGVDSAVAALRLKDAGYEVAGAYMRTWFDEKGSGILSDCPWEADIQIASAVAKHLGIGFEVVNLIDGYRKHVVNYLIEGYSGGQTPNPDIMCNRYMKFGYFRQYALDNGFDGIGTGHYARIQNQDQRPTLQMGLDPDKDQSYFLAMVKHESFQQVLFPIGDIQKKDVRALAEAAKLPNAKRKDSQGICFLGKVRIADFLDQYIGENPGAIVHAEDHRTLGEHRGLHHYTIGQRKGIGVPSNTDNENYVVVGKDTKQNQLLVAFDKPNAPGLYTHSARVGGFNWLGDAITENLQASGRVRYRDPTVSFRFEPLCDGTAQIHFDQPQRALATGQILALYDGEQLLGGCCFL